MEKSIFRIKRKAHKLKINNNLYCTNDKIHFNVFTVIAKTRASNVMPFIIY